MIGDVWLTRSFGGPGWKGWLGRKFADAITYLKPGLHTEYNHAAMDVGDGRLIEAAGRGVVLTDKSSYLNSSRYLVAIYRPLGYNGSELNLLRDEAQNWIGVSYSWLTVIAQLGGRRFKRWIAGISKDKICSELVATIYDNGLSYRFRKRHTNGVFLDPREVRPRDIAFTVEREVNWLLVWKADLRAPDRAKRAEEVYRELS